MAQSKRRREEAERARQRRVLLTFGVLGAVLVAVVLVLALREPPPAPGGGTGARALPFTLPDQNGRQVTIQADGKPVVVELMATWCPYCAYEAKYDLPEILPYVKSKGARFVEVNATDQLGIGTPGVKGQPGTGQDGSRATPTGDPDQAFQAELKRYVETYPAAGQTTFLYDAHGIVADRFNLQAYPTFVLLDGQGRIVASQSEVVEPDAFKQWFDGAFSKSR